MVNIVRRHRSLSTEVITDGDGVLWAPKPLHISYTFQVEDKPIWTAQSMKVTKIAIISTAIMQREVKLANTMQNDLSYARVFSDIYAVCFFDVCMMDIVEYERSSSFMAANSSFLHTKHYNWKDDIQEPRCTPYFREPEQRRSSDKFFWRYVH